MLLPENIHPENTLMYNGILIVKVLRSTDQHSLIDLYLNAKKENDRLTMGLFVLSLDWLFLANCVSLNEHGKVTLCS